jgi:hypothetical protein
MPQIFQLTKDDIARSSTLDGRDLGKWVWVANGCLIGFTDTREEAVDMLDNHLPPHVICPQESL